MVIIEMNNYYWLIVKANGHLSFPKNSLYNKLSLSYESVIEH